MDEASLRELSDLLMRCLEELQEHDREYMHETDPHVLRGLAQWINAMEEVLHG